MMSIKKGDYVYSVTEAANDWKIKAKISKVVVSYSVPKEFCKTMADLEKYVIENDIF